MVRQIFESGVPHSRPSFQLPGLRLGGTKTVIITIIRISIVCKWSVVLQSVARLAVSWALSHPGVLVLMNKDC